jgi:hypothetical protein
MFPFPLGQEEFPVSGKALAACFSTLNAPAASVLRSAISRTTLGAYVPFSSAPLSEKKQARMKCCCWSVEEAVYWYVSKRSSILASRCWRFFRSAFRAASRLGAFGTVGVALAACVFLGAAVFLAAASNLCPQSQAAFRTCTIAPHLGHCFWGAFFATFFFPISFSSPIDEN